jgi:3-methyladenine DNA glycosylase/8-oxoguanine DNA glycosylase
MTREGVQERVVKLQARRAQVVRQRAAEITRIDAAITELQAILAAWDTMSIEQAMAALTRIGLTVKVEQG